MTNPYQTNQIFIDKPHAEIKEVKDLPEPNKNLLRVYCRQHPNVFVFQIRTHKPIDQHQSGKHRDMIANVTLTIEEVEDILRRMKAEAGPIIKSVPTQDPENLESVDLIAGSYEWVCLNCEETNSETEIIPVVVCQHCSHEYSTGEAIHPGG